VLAPGDRIPAEALVWQLPSAGPVQLAAAIACDRLALLCFYPFDWSPT
jgi:hypothetical protein